MTSLKLAVAVAKAKSNTRKRKAANASKTASQAAHEELMIKTILSKLPEPTHGRDGSRGLDGRNAPTITEIMAKVIPLIPQPVERVVKQEINFGDIEEFVRGMLPAEDPTMRPKVEQIVEQEVPSTSTKQKYVTQDDLNDALRRVQSAIEQSSGGSSIPRSIIEDVADNTQEIDSLTEALTNLITELLTQGETSQLTREELVSAIDHTREELELLNMRTEEAFDTKLDRKDIT